MVISIRTGINPLLVTDKRAHHFFIRDISGKDGILKTDEVDIPRDNNFSSKSRLDWLRNSVKSKFNAGTNL